MSEIFRVRRHRITIQRKIPMSVFGWPLWQRVCQTWAELHGDPISVATIRYKPDLFPGMRAIVGDQHYEITAVFDRAGKTRLTELHVEEIKKPGVIGIAWRALAMNSD